MTLHTTLVGGGFGRRAVPDNPLREYARPCRFPGPCGRPIKVIWTREDDTLGGYYRPRAYHSVRAAARTRQARCWHGSSTWSFQSFLAGTPFAGLIKDGVDGAAVEGAQ